jgi:circumsporozoite protein (fragment)
MGNPENRGGNALNNEGGRNDAFDVWSKALASKASWEERAKQIAKEVKGGVPSWRDNESDGVEWADISLDKNINKPDTDNTNDANLASEPAKDEYIYHISPEDVRGVDPELVVDITGILNAKKMNQDKDKGAEKGPDEDKSSEENTTEKNGNNKTDVDTKEDDVDSAKTPDDEKFTNKEEIEKEVTKNWNSLKRYEEASALNPENLEKKRGLVAGLLEKIKTSGFGKRVAIRAIVTVLTGMTLFPIFNPGARAKKGNMALNNQTAIESTQDTLDVAEDNQNVLDETNAEKTDGMIEVTTVSGDKLMVDGTLRGSNNFNNFFDTANKRSEQSLGTRDGRLANEREVWEEAESDPAKMNEYTKMSIESLNNTKLEIPKLTLDLYIYGYFGENTLSDEELEQKSFELTKNPEAYEKACEWRKNFENEKREKGFKYKLAFTDEDFLSQYATAFKDENGVDHVMLKGDSFVDNKTGRLLLVEVNDQGVPMLEMPEYASMKKRLLERSGVSFAGLSPEQVKDKLAEYEYLGEEDGCGGQQGSKRKTYKYSTPKDSSTHNNKTPNDSSTHNNVTPTPDKEPVPVPTPEPEPQPQTPGENIVTPNDKPGDKPGNNPNDKPGDKPGENPGGNPGGKTVELKGKTDYVGVDFDQNDNEATGTETDQNRSVAIKDEGENNILENGAGDVEENGQAFAEQAGNEYKATIGDKSEDNERTVEVGDVDTDSRTTAEAAQTFENDDHTVNEKADEDSNGFENFTYENLFN